MPTTSKTRTIGARTTPAEYNVCARRSRGLFSPLGWRRSTSDQAGVRHAVPSDEFRLALGCRRSCAAPRPVQYLEDRSMLSSRTGSFCAHVDPIWARVSGEGSGPDGPSVRITACAASRGGDSDAEHAASYGEQVLSDVRIWTADPVAFFAPVDCSSSSALRLSGSRRPRRGRTRHTSG